MLKNRNIPFKAEVNIKNLATETKSIISIMHTAVEEDALKLKAAVEDTFKNAEIIINQAGPVLGTHAGPRALALIAVPMV